MLEIDGRFFTAPGLGVATSGHSTRTVRLCQTMERNIAKMRKDFESNSIEKPLLKQISRSIGIPVKVGVRMKNGQLMLYDKSRNLDIMLLMPAI
jgi:hypothetical protein